MLPYRSSSTGVPRKRRKKERRYSSTRSGWKIAKIICRRKCPAGRSSASRWRGPWLLIRRFYWPTNPPATWTRRLGSLSCRCCVTSIVKQPARSSWSPTARRRPVMATGQFFFATAKSRGKARDGALAPNPFLAPCTASPPEDPAYFLGHNPRSRRRCRYRRRQPLADRFFSIDYRTDRGQSGLASLQWRERHHRNGVPGNSRYSWSPGRGGCGGGFFTRRRSRERTLVCVRGRSTHRHGDSQPSIRRRQVRFGSSAGFHLSARLHRAHGILFPPAQSAAGNENHFDHESRQAGLHRARAAQGRGHGKGLWRKPCADGPARSAAGFGQGRQARCRGPHGGGRGKDRDCQRTVAAAAPGSGGGRKAQKKRRANRASANLVSDRSILCEPHRPFCRVLSHLQHGVRLRHPEEARDRHPSMFGNETQRAAALDRRGSADACVDRLFSRQRVWVAAGTTCAGRGWRNGRKSFLTDRLGARDFHSARAWPVSRKWSCGGGACRAVSRAGSGSCEPSGKCQTNRLESFLPRKKVLGGPAWFHLFASFSHHHFFAFTFSGTGAAVQCRRHWNVDLFAWACVSLPPAHQLWRGMVLAMGDTTAGLILGRSAPSLRQLTAKSCAFRHYRRYSGHQLGGDLYHRGVRQ